MKILLMIALMILPGCTTNLAWRGVVINTTQDVQTGGMVHNQPASGNASVAAEKTTDLKADVPLAK